MGLFSANPSIKPCDRKRVLIVDDEPPIRQVFKMILAESLPGIVFDQACNGLEAVRRFQENHHGVILMDLRMPEMDGLQAFAAIQDRCAKDSLQMPSVVFCTGYAPPDAVDRIVSECKDHCLLRKPVQSNHLVDVIRSRVQGP